MAATNVTANSALTNGVSFGLSYTITATDATNAAILFDFGTTYNLVPSIQVVTSGGVNVPLVDAVITQPAVGQIQIANGGTTFTLTAGDIIYLIVQREGVAL